MDKDIGSRLTEAREAAGYRTQKAAAEALGVGVSTYAHHESGARTPKSDAILHYAAHYGVDPCWIMLGKQGPINVADVSSSTLKQIIQRVLSHENAHNIEPEKLADLIIELCRFVSRSGMSGAESVIDFQMHQRERKRG